ncbi:hypothetical protein [Pontibacillus yanchengensis]|uniref:Uncharacterized protein n=1 Tax=Pontibacillus yanchengensis Y32 TaxID=1385514 RepID=A0A0A2TAR0_9BACI|nr:hypothetical protein [Pontibacillus yanchengensis]KGP71513.1 hypothetical protein N782_18500 [Pontibacillus yanchengensis Y32]
MNTQTAMKDMQEKVQELLTAKDAVEATVDNMEEQKEQGEQALQEMQEDLQQAQETKETATNVTEVKDAVRAINQLTEDIELQESVNVAMNNKGKQELFNVADEFYQVYNQAKMMYKPLYKSVIEDASINSIDTDIEKMNEVANPINVCFGSVNSILTDKGIIERGQNQFKGTGRHVHLKQVGLDTVDLKELKRAYQPIINKYFTTVR